MPQYVGFLVGCTRFAAFIVSPNSATIVVYKTTTCWKICGGAPIMTSSIWILVTSNSSDKPSTVAIALFRNVSTTNADTLHAKIGADDSPKKSCLCRQNPRCRPYGMCIVPIWSLLVRDNGNDG